MSDIETALRETLNRHAAGAPAAAAATPELLTAVRRRRARTSVVLCAGTIVAVLAIVLGIRLGVPTTTVEPAPSPHPRSVSGMVYVGPTGGLWERADDGSTTDWKVRPGWGDFCGLPCIPDQLAWSPDGRTLAVSTAPACCLESIDVTLVVMSAGGADVHRLFRCPPGTGCAHGLAYSLAWSGDSKQIALATNKELYVIPLDGGTPDLVCTCAPLGVAFLPDGRLTYTVNDAVKSNFSTEPGEVKVIDLGSRQTSTLMTVTELTEAAWSPDGNYVVINRGDDLLSLIDASAPAPWTPGSVYAHGIGVRWSPSGNRFAFAGKSGHELKTFRAQLWIGAPGQPARLLHQFDGNLGWSPPVWSPDGSMVGTYYDNAIWLFDPDSGRLVDKVTATGRGAAWQQAPETDQ